MSASRPSRQGTPHPEPANDLQHVIHPKTTIMFMPVRSHSTSTWRFLHAISLRLGSKAGQLQIRDITFNAWQDSSSASEQISYQGSVRIFACKHGVQVPLQAQQSQNQDNCAVATKRTHGWLHSGRQQWLGTSNEQQYNGQRHRDVYWAESRQEPWRSWFHTPETAVRSRQDITTQLDQHTQDSCSKSW